MDLKFWQKALREAERELDAATTRTALDAAAKKLMRIRPILLQSPVAPKRPTVAHLRGPSRHRDVRLA